MDGSLRIETYLIEKYLQRSHSTTSVHLSIASITLINYSIIKAPPPSLGNKRTKGKETPRGTSSSSFDNILPSWYCVVFEELVFPLSRLLSVLTCHVSNRILCLHPTWTLEPRVSTWRNLVENAHNRSYPIVSHFDFFRSYFLPEWHNSQSLMFDIINVCTSYQHL